MFKYVTAEQFNQANWQNLKDKPFKDDWSRYVIKSLLNQYSQNVKSVFEYKGCNCLDLKLTMVNKTHLGVEIKFRSETSNTYESHLINDEKFFSICKRADRKWINGALLTTIWYDGVIWCSDIFGEYTVEQHLQNKTTNVSYKTDGHKEWKNCYCYKPQQVFYFCYEYDEELNQYTPYFSTEPIDVNQLNKEAEGLASCPLF